MPKVFRYPNITVPVQDNDQVTFKVEMISDGNQAHTIIDIPGSQDPEICNNGSAILGRGNLLRDAKVLAISNVINPLETVSEIRIRYTINGHIVVEHFNSTMEERRPTILLSMLFQ